MDKLRILTARFANVDRDAIIVEYGIKRKGAPKEAHHKEVMTYDSTNPAVQEVLKKFPVIKLEENYINWGREEGIAKKKIMDAVKLLENDEWETFESLKKAGIDFNVVDSELLEIKGSISLGNILDCNKDILFKVKLEIFDHKMFTHPSTSEPAMKGPSGNEWNLRQKAFNHLKSEIRKAKTLMETLHIFYPFYKAYLENPDFFRKDHWDNYKDKLSGPE